MRQLHLVGMTADRRGIVLSDQAGDGVAAGSFVVRIDERLMRAVKVASARMDAERLASRAGPGRPGGTPRPRARRAAGTEEGAHRVPDGEGESGGVAPGQAGGSGASSSDGPDQVRLAEGEPPSDGVRAAGGDQGEPAHRSGPAALPPQPPPVGALSPREIQSRLRAGRSVAQVAREARVSEEWVERFALPVLAEQHSAVTRAGQLVFSPGRRGPSARPLAEAVRANLLRRGVRMSEEEFASAWSAFLHQGSEWVVTVAYQRGRRRYEAQWLVDLAAKSVVAVDRLAATLAFVGDEPILPAVGPAGPAPLRRQGGSRPAPTRAAAAETPLGHQLTLDTTSGPPREPPTPAPSTGSTEEAERGPGGGRSRAGGSRRTPAGDRAGQGEPALRRGSKAEPKAGAAPPRRKPGKLNPPADAS